MTDTSTIFLPSNRTPEPIQDRGRTAFVEVYREGRPKATFRDFESVGKATRPEPRSIFLAQSNKAPTILRDVNTAWMTLARWEGVVQSIDREKGTMSVTLVSKSGSEPEHAADLLLSSVSEDDADLVEEGAVFYLEQMQRQVRRTISQTQSLSFRRLPAWTAAAIASVEQVSENMRKRFKTPVMAE